MNLRECDLPLKCTWPRNFSFSSWNLKISLKPCTQQERFENFPFLYVKHEFVKFVSETGKTHEDTNLHPLSSLIFDWQISGARNVFACKWRKSQQLTLIHENNTANIYQQFDLNKPFNHSSVKNHSLPFVYDGTSFSNVLLRKFLYATWKLTSGEER